ncbi:hypothetical protein A359_02930 [secondary endosymbiont of Ctenarytaina eucalypti]|uniref:Uncharacterized protein n=1 Tax=secondary endosymbiont of Ctenarytaina eucalypti TaxID=1199245 RepID=J3Z385_9ENTR|nr:hypothetical protein A359_02930 [secondary endosymbiont of Ctenarytaina eucalypti]
MPSVIHRKRSSDVHNAEDTSTFLCAVQRPLRYGLSSLAKKSLSLAQGYFECLAFDGYASPPKILKLISQVKRNSLPEKRSS